MAKSKQSENELLFQEPTAVQVGLKNCCPRCGKGKLFASILKPAKNCKNCNLDFSFIDAGDGPAVFVILIIGFIVTALAIGVQNAYAPPVWVHMLIWLPTIIILCIWGLQFSKAILIALQYQTKAKEGELEDKERG